MISRPRLALLGLLCLAAPWSCNKALRHENTRPPSASGEGAQPGTGATTSTGGSGSSPNEPKPGDGGSGAESGADTGGSSATGGTAPQGGQITGFSGSTSGGSGGSSNVSTTPPKFTKKALLTALAECATASYGEFDALADSLGEATTKLADDPSDANDAAARTAWLGAIASWQRAEPLAFGPAASTMSLGGQAIRDQIYIFPLGSSCLIDQSIVSKGYESASFSSSLGSARGLTAVEYLLFHAGAGNSCNSLVNINASGSWAALSASELRGRRAKYAKAAAADVRARAKALVAAWSPEQGNFYSTFVKAGSGSTVYASNQDAFNVVSDALFYVEQELKDWKLGWPLGLVADCVNAPNTCPNDVESRYARVSTDHLRQNLIGFRRGFQGCGLDYYGLGFDDWLVSVGAEDLSERMLAALVGAQQAVDDLNPPLESAIVTSPQKVAAVHAAVKKLTDSLKTEFVTVLNLELPAGSEGDND
jgi:predicted lipoprotein